MAEKSKILIIGSTGDIGKFIVEASAVSGHPTFALVRETTASNPHQAKLINQFRASGVTVLYGDLNDRESLVSAFKQVDVVISAVGGFQLGNQIKILDVIKEVGNVKRFFPSEFGVDVDRSRTVDPAKAIVDVKVKIRRALEASGIPYTYVVANVFFGYALPTLAQPEATGPPADNITILGDGNTQAIFVDEKDIGTYTIRAVDDPRTLNKSLYLSPPANIYSHNELIALWEKKSGKTFHKSYLSEEEILKKIGEAPFPLNNILAINYSVLVTGDTTKFEIDPSFGVEASELYPDVKYTTVEEYISNLF